MKTLLRLMGRAGWPGVLSILLASSLVAQVVTTTAGGFVGDGGSATMAALDYPEFIAHDKSGNLYISEFAGQRIRKVTPGGVISTYAGTGISGFSGDGGPANAAQLSFPTGITLDPKGDLIIAEQGNNRIRKIDRHGIITTIAGTGVAGYSGDGGPALQATLNDPFGVVYDKAGNLYITDIRNYVVRIVNTAGIINTYAGNGTAGYGGDGGPATSASLNFPRGMAFDGSGNLYIADTLNHRVRVVSTAGIINTFAGNGQAGFSGDGGAATSAAIGNPRGLAFRSGTLYIGNAGLDNIRTVPIRTGVINTYAGSGYGYDGDGNPLLSSLFAIPSGLLFNSAGDFLVVDTQNQRLRQATSGVMETIAGGFIGDGSMATSAALVVPEAISFDKAGDYYIADSNGNRIRKVNAAGEIRTVAGTGVSGYSGDGGAATAAMLYYPLGVTLDSVGNLYVADDGNNVIRKVDTSGNISTFATNANFSGLGVMAADSSNNLYVVDQGTCVVWKVSPSGTVSVVAGVEFTCGYNGDKIPATTAQLNTPVGVALDSHGNIFIADYGNNRIRKVNAKGTISTFAGNGTCGFLGDSGPPGSAELCSPEGVAAAAGGTVNIADVYIADTGNFRIRKVHANTISTYAGTGLQGYNGDGLPALSTNLDDPVSVTLDPSGVPYVVDDETNRVRKIH
jgi:trimeric autotransporter adhesin